MKIFTEDLMRRIPSPDKFTRSQFVRIAGGEDPQSQALRNLIEEWFEGVGGRGKEDLRRRLQSQDDRQFLPALYELALHQFCLDAGWGVLHNPRVEEGNPDLLARAGESEFLVEVSTILRSRAVKRRESQFIELLRRLDGFPHPFHLGVHLLEWLPEDFDPKAVLYFVWGWLNRLDPQGERVERTVYIRPGISLSFEATPRGDDKKGGTIAWWTHPPHIADSDAQVWRPGRIAKILGRKIKKYKSLKSDPRPLVIALCSGGDPAVGRYDLEGELLGYRRVLVKPQGTVKWERDMSGLIAPTLHRSARNTRLSAVWFCEWDFGQIPPASDMRIYHNPWAQHPLPKGIFQHIPQLVPEEVAEDAAFLRWIDGREKSNDRQNATTRP
ncbi:MAG: hypothetical protein ACUVXI_17695 [bacterium]